MPTLLTSSPYKLQNKPNNNNNNKNKNNNENNKYIMSVKMVKCNARFLWRYMWDIIHKIANSDLKLRNSEVKLRNSEVKTSSKEIKQWNKDVK